MKTTELIITSSAFYRNSLFVERKMHGEVAVASGRYTTRYGVIDFYGENYGKDSQRKPFFCFDFTYESRTYRCSFEEWLTDGTIRLRALRFVEQCVALAPERAPTQWAYEQACAAIEKHRQRADAAEAQAPKWIATSERLPEAEYWSESVLTLWNTGAMTVQPWYNSSADHLAYLHHAGRFLDETPYQEDGQAYVTHWLPLPAASSEGKPTA
jgi:hypothetical protein